MLHQWKFWKFALLAGFCSSIVGASPAVAQTGNFFAVLNNANNFGDARRSVLFYDANDFSSGPLFSVFVGYERTLDYTDPSAIDVDPITGDVYVVEFDNTFPSGTSGVSVGVNAPYPNDVAGDMDVYKINFATVYNNWEANYKGKDVRTLGLVGGPAPSGSKNSLNLDYVTYGAPDPTGTAFDGSHSNTVVLANSIGKVAEVKRNYNGDSSGFFPYSVTFIDSDNLFLIDDSSATSVTDTAETDHEYRIINRLASGAAEGTLDHLDGGFTNGASQVWQSTRIGKVALDVAGHSEPESSGYYKDPVSGVQGMWVTESDTAAGAAGDDVAFLQLTPNATTGYASGGYRGLTTGAPSFALDNDPAVSTSTNDGKSDNIFVDKDSGDVLIIESGFNDLADGFDTVDKQPSVLRLNINSYASDGAGGAGNMIEMGTWEAKVTLNPTLSTGATGLVRGQWTAWDSATDRMYFAMPGFGADTPANEMDIWVLDMNASSPTFGQTLSFLDLDDSVNLFTSDGFGDKTVAFSLAAAEDADFDNDNDVDGNDFLIWQRGLGVGNNNATGDADGNGIVNAADLGIWKSQFGVAATAVAGAVPEPTSLAMGAFGCLAAVASSRRRRHA
ncbi:MAG: hypothetical protein C0485_06555 [Pirellula sp.]|nr:hypothetical protein [Pirellula sp.]